MVFARPWPWLGAAALLAALVKTGAVGPLDALGAPLRSDASAWHAITLMGNESVLVGVGIVAVALLWRLEGPVPAAWMTLVSGIGWAVSRGTKLLMARPRPLDGAFHLDSYAFPSGHALGSLVVFGAWALLGAPSVRGMWWAAVGVGVLIGLSRVALGVHYLSDVLAGWCLAMALLMIMQAIRRSSGRPGPDGGDPPA